MRQIRVHELAEAVGPYVIDVREVHEFVTGHIPGAVNVPISALAARYRDLPMDRTVFVVCELGVRSSQATQALGDAGWEVVNVSGGTQAWTRAGYPLEN